MLFVELSAELGELVAPLGSDQRGEIASTEAPLRVQEATEPSLRSTRRNN
jgi:hypothetical protein